MSTVQTILDRKGSMVLAVHPGITVYSAACLMNEKHIGGLVVLEDNVIAGVFTERDILKRVVGAGLDPAYTTVREVMTTPVSTCSPEMPVDELVEIMTQRRMRHIPVVRDGYLKGIVTSGDVFVQQLLDSRAQLTYLNEYMHGA
jgi:CBS domain-containing protein